jgi:hypothetical protein
MPRPTGAAEPSLPEKIIAIDDRLRKARIPHAFGGALALAYYAEPRVTIDIDLNLFVPPPRYARVLKAIGPLGIGDDIDPKVVERDGQCRLWWSQTPIDLFFANDEIHDAMRKAARLVPFGDHELRVLSPEHLLVCKAAFDRPKDWIDIEQMLVTVERLDLEEIERWLSRFVADDDPRRERFDRLVSQLRNGETAASSRG